MITFRSAEKRDIDFILEAFEEVNFSSHGEKRTASSKGRLEKDIFSDNPKAWVLIAEVNGELAGLTLYSDVYYAEEGAIMWISQFYVDKDYRKYGIFFKMVKELSKIAKEKGYPFAGGAATDENSRANKIYERLASSKCTNLNLYYRKI